MQLSLEAILICSNYARYDHISQFSGQSVHFPHLFFLSFYHFCSKLPYNLIPHFDFLSPFVYNYEIYTYTCLFNTEHLCVHMYMSPRKGLSLIYDTLWYYLVIVCLLFVKTLCLLRKKNTCKYQMAIMS